MNLQNRGLKLSRSPDYQPVLVFIQRQGEGSKRKLGFESGVGTWVGTWVGTGRNPSGGSLEA